MTDAAAGRIYFTTDALPERERFPAFCEGLFRNVIGADIARLDFGPFSGTLDVRRLGALGLAELSVTPARITRQQSHIADGNDAVVVQVWQSGSAGLEQSGRANRAVAGQGFVIDNARPAQLRIQSECRVQVMTIPRSAFTTGAADSLHQTGSMPAESAGFRLLAGYLQEIGPFIPESGRTAQVLGKHLIDLAAFAIMGVEASDNEREGVRAARLSAILREINRRSGEPCLSAAGIAPKIGVTPRYVHLLLEETGKSFTHHVLERRLEKAATLLRDPRWRGRKIADIAAEAGFTDLSYFNRAFRRHFGATPSDIRANAVDEARQG
jgi:AraC-like DNA-binding protein